MASNAPRAEAEPVWTLFLFIAVLIFAGFIVWSFFRVEFLQFLRYLRLGELWVIGLFSDQEEACYTWLRQAPIGDDVALTQDNVRLANNCFGVANLQSVMPAIAFDFYRLTGQSIGIIGHRIAHYLRIPLAIYFGAVAFYALLLSPRTKFKSRYDLEGFIKVQHRMWPVLSPIVKFKPSSKSARIPGSQIPDKLPPFAEALSPEEWLSFHRIHVINGIPDREATRQSLIQQLGPRWNGIEGQPPYIQALFAAYALKGVQKRDESDELLGRLSTCWTVENGFNMPADIAAEIKRLVHNPEIGGEAAKIAAQHAYRTTAMLGVLRWSRMMGGVLATAQFLWLRAVDRVLWYPANNLGRRSFHVEGAGAMAHFMAEQNAKKPLPIPRVDTAIMALNQFLADPEKHPMDIPPREEPRVG